MKLLDINPLKASKARQQGFTIIELTVASMVFAVILLLVAGTIVRFTNNFQRGVVQSSTQSTARAVMDTIAEAVQNGRSVSAPSDTQYCLGTTRYELRRGDQLTSATGDYALRQTLGLSNGCSGTGTATQELIGRDMRLSHLDVRRVESGEDLYRITVVVAYGDDDLFIEGDATRNATSRNPTCKIEKGLQFCAVSELSTLVKPWL